MSKNPITSACDIAILSAAEFLKRRGVNNIDVKLLSTVLRVEVKRDLPQAIEDASDAVGANMSQIGAATITASMKLAGINAAQKYLDAVLVG